MTDGRAYDDQGLPWLEAVDDEDGPRAVSASKMLAAVVIVLVAAALVAGTFFLLGRRDPVVVDGAPELIAAEPGPYKVKPDEPGGLDVAGDSGTAFATSAGEDSDAALAGVPNDAPPIAEPEEQPKPKKIPPNETKVPAKEDPASTPAGPAGPSIQLGAYASTVKADTAWRLLSGRFPSVAALNKTVLSATVGGKTIYRLRATGSADATRAACAALKAAGESCLQVN